MWRSLCLLSLPFYSFTLLANCSDEFDLERLAEKKPQISAIHFEQNNVFDLTEPGVFWLHRFANASHRISLEGTIRDDLLFNDHAPLNLADLAETERLLRSRRYIRDARVSVSRYCPTENTVEVLVRTWDTWSLLPKIDFSSEGGETEYSLGIAEDNLLGYGNQIHLDYTKDSERSGYLVSFGSPNIFGTHWNTFLSYANNSDGENYRFNVQRPFYRLDSQWSLNFDLLKNKELVTDYQLDERVNEYNRTRQQFESSVGFKLVERGRSIQRFIVGMTLEDVAFNDTEGTVLTLPDERNLSAIWLEYQILEDDFYKLYNINQFNRVEDINAGWQLQLRLGYLQSWLGADNSGLQLTAHAEKAWQLQEHTWLFGQLNYRRLNWQDKTQQLLHFSWQLNHQLNEYNSVVASISAERGSNLFADERLYLGGDTGLRAFPLYYQSGDKRVIATAEYRRYTDWNLWRIFDVGFAAFTDIGRSWGDSEQFKDLMAQPDIDDKVLFGVGVGVRLLSSHSSRGTMVHLDLTRPFSDNPDINNWQWRATAKRRF
ncbi:MAG: BamA/TamA family outer membrane protein [Alishewanella sp.]|nr:BamA/TamA family outer membrane protein [Alishewanella sp.]MDP5188219.1 BamA/TamA family outer membrane protein [Alishewanella sp.]